jgi:replication factor C small subunit
MTLTTVTTKSKISLAEKYRPKLLADCVLLPRDRQHLESLIQRRCSPHILLLGPYGVGKTSVASAFAREMNWNVLERNGRLAVTLDSIRDEIAPIALPHGILPILDDGRSQGVFLDEADLIPPQAQAALRRMMEEAAAGGSSTFILAANNPANIDGGIRSRCAVFDFNYVGDDLDHVRRAFRERIGRILAAEDIQPDWPSIDRMLDQFWPDFRATLNELEKYMPA